MIVDSNEIGNYICIWYTEHKNNQTDVVFQIIGHLMHFSGPVNSYLSERSKCPICTDVRNTQANYNMESHSGSTKRSITIATGNYKYTIAPRSG